MTLQEIREAMANGTYISPPKSDYDYDDDDCEEIVAPDKECVMCSGTGKMYATEGEFTTCLCCYE